MLTLCLPVQKVGVPEYGVAGKMAALTCTFSPTAGIYSLRWYKNGQEFFRYTPSMIL